MQDSNTQTPSTSVVIPMDTPPDLRPSYSTIVSNLFWSGGLLFIRALFMLVQIVGKRLMYVEADENLLVGFAGIAAFEDMIFILTFGALSYLTSRISQAMGKSNLDPKEIGQLFRSGLLLTASLVGIAGIICLFAKPIYRLFQQPAIVVDNSWPYFSKAFFAYLFDFLYRTLVRTLIGLKLFFPPLIADMGEGILDLLLTYYFVVRCRMGLPGSALAYALSAFTTLTLFTGYILNRSDLEKYHLFHFSEGLADFRNIIFRGYRMGGAATLEYLTQFLVTFYCGLSGSNALLGMQAASAYSMSVVLPVGAMVEAGCVHVGENFEKKNVLYRTYGKASIFFSAVYAGFFGLLLNLFPDFFASLFLSHPGVSKDALDTVTKFMKIQSLIELLNSIKSSSSGILSACNLTGFSFSVSLFFVFVVNATFATLAHFLLKSSAVATYATQITGFIFSALTIAMAWQQQNKTPSNVFTKTFQSLNGYCNAFWDGDRSEAPVELSRVDMPNAALPSGLSAV